MDREEKRLREEIGGLVEDQEKILNAAKATGRGLKNDEVHEFEKIQNQINSKRSALHNHLNGHKNPLANSGGFDVATGLPTGALSGGRTLDEDGRIRLYAPGQNISADIAESHTGVGLGGYLRSVVDKPRTSAERMAVQNSVTSGGYTLPTRVASELIDKLRAMNPVIAAGARTISIDGLDSTKFVKINDDPQAVWHAELAEESFSDPNFGSITMKPKTVICLTELSRELLQDAENIDEALVAAFTGSLNTAILNATFSGSAATEPTGLSTVITQTEEYPNTGAPDWSHFVKASKTLHDKNVPNDGRSFIHAPDVWETLALSQDNNNRYQDAPSFIREVPNFTSSGVPVGEAYAGDFSNVVYGFRLNVTLEQHQSYSVRKYGTVWMAAARLDMAVFKPNALVRIEEAAAG